MSPHKKVYQFFAQECSFYSGKIRPYLRYKNIPHETVVPSIQVHRDILIPRAGWSVVPVIITPEDKVVQDTTAIIEYLEQKHPHPPVVPPTPRQNLVSLLLELFADEWLVLPAMHYRWSKTEHKKYVDLNFGFVIKEHTLPLEQMENLEDFKGYSFFKNSIRFLGINNDTTRAVEQSYQEFLQDFQQHLNSYPFLLGYQPCVADFAFCGPLYGHLYRDPVPGYLMKCQAPLVASYIERMNGAVLSPSHDVIDGRAVRKSVPSDKQGFLPGDEIPATLQPILHRMFTEQVPVLLDTVKKVSQYMKENPDVDVLPRVIGLHDFRLGDVTSQRGVYTYPIWMLQRITDYYHSLSPGQQRMIDTFLDSYPRGHELVQADLSGCRVDRMDVRVRRAEPAKAKL
ncbi:Hypp4710 [Branchiostoma lanceolatum]|uniref:Hypp4710 protein n=1 Tax=Branchiostoma lanceolatum TaxID=7740 RepID=A0A8K0F1Z5_BRALA|nr:Hypp4710 [Branchiostoma lanceolatum]